MTTNNPVGFITPMLAAPMPKSFDIRPGIYAVEEKFDGHRLIARIGGTRVQAWSRNGLERVLPPHLIEALSQFPDGVYDGELNVPGKRSYGVTEIVNGPDLVFTIFDLIEVLGVSIAAQTYDRRREYLREIFSRERLQSRAVKLSLSTELADEDHMHLLLKAVWARDGEGLIIKRRASRYTAGKRPKEDWIKVKALRSAVLTIVGFIPSKGKIQDRGPFATVVLKDDEGHETTVKTKNDAELARFEREQPTEDFMVAPHPALGRKLRIEYHERTPDGSYRSPRWDRWEDE
jgi:ATP-dependent DNA ligase